MQQHVKYLVVEDEEDWRKGLARELDRYFRERCHLDDERIISDTAADADQANTRLKNLRRVDLVTLDMRLDNPHSKSKVSGLQLLGKIAERNQAFFVIIITGAINDPGLETVYGEHAALIRYGLMNEAVKLLPAARVRILHKPRNNNVAAALRALRPYLHSALDQYRSVSRERYIFRPFVRRKGKDTLWQFCFDGGDVAIASEVQGFEIYRSALHQPNREMKIIALLRAIAAGSGAQPAVPRLEGAYAIEPAESTGTPSESTSKPPGVRSKPDPRTAKQSLDPKDLEKMTVLEGIPSDVSGDIEPELIIRLLLQTRRSGGDMKRILDATAAEYGSWIVRSVPPRIRYYLAWEHRTKADNEFNGTIGYDQKTHISLEEVLNEVEPLIQRLELRDAAQTASAAKSEDGSEKAKVRSGTDTKELERARTQRVRAMDELRKLGLDDMVAHFKRHMKEGEELKGRICYKFDKEDDFPPFWLTE